MNNYLSMVTIAKKNTMLQWATKLFLIFLLSVTAISCNKAKDTNWYKTGSFYVPATLEYGKEEIYRNDSIQVSTYDGQTASFRIEWQDRFNYKLKRIDPKNEIESTPVLVKIIDLNKKENTVTFEANFEGSTFFQRNKMIKVPDEETSTEGETK